MSLATLQLTLKRCHIIRHLLAISVFFVVTTVYAFAANDYAPLLPPDPPEYTFNQLKRVIDRNEIYKVEDLIVKLPHTLLENYTLMHTSKSLQSSTKLNPRVILFGNTADLVLTFNGEPNLTKEDSGGYYSIETMEYQRNDKRFVFREIKFDPSGMSKPQISLDNPSKCLKCHSTYAQPIWFSYNRWPGAFGEFDDGLDVRDEAKKEEADLSDLLDWKIHAEGHPRYKLLTQSRPEFPGSNHYFPYYVNSTDKLKIDSNLKYYFMPNFRLGLLLTEKLARVSAKSIIQNNFYAQLKYRLGSYCATRIKNRINIAYPTTKTDITLSNLNLLNTYQLGLDPDKAGIENFRTGNPGADYLIEICKDILRNLAEEDSYISSEIQGNAISAFYGTQVPLLYALIENKSTYSADASFLAPLNEKTAFAEISKPLCKYLDDKSDAEEKKFPRPELMLKIISKDPLIHSLINKRCVTCHDENGSRKGVGPDIPFGSKEKLQDFLQKKPDWRDKIINAADPTNNTRKQMPPKGQKLTPDEYNDLVNFIKGL